MIDYIRENFSYYPIYYRLLFRTKKEFIRYLLRTDVCR